MGWWTRRAILPLLGLLSLLALAPASPEGLAHGRGHRTGHVASSAVTTAAPRAALNPAAARRIIAATPAPPPRVAPTPLARSAAPVRAASSSSAIAAAVTAGSEVAAVPPAPVAGPPPPATGTVAPAIAAPAVPEIRFVPRTPSWLPLALAALLGGLLLLLVVLVYRRREHADQAAALERAKSDFMTLASHQLRTPLSIIRGYVSMAEEGLLGELPKPLAQALPVVSGRAAEMEELVGDILLATELEAGGAELSRERIDLREMLTDVADAVRRTHPAARLRLRTARDPILISADRERLARAVTAMLEAAADLAPEGAEVVAGVRRDGDLVRADATAPAPDATPEDDVEPLFVPFSAAAGPRAGLGLHIARELARRHGGELVARPATGRITFVLRLPQA